jgi:photosystem II stability/assembly factor-like uncharacterized protein
MEKGSRFGLVPVAAVALASCFLPTSSIEGQAPGKKSAPAKASRVQPKFKAIWEPVNVPEDLQLASVHFVSAEEGWVAGGKTTHAGGVVYHTKDGGKSWELQVGDPESSDRGFTDLQFVDATHGFAVQGNTGNTHKLFSTSDGQTWTLAGTVPEHRYDLFFVSPTTGFVADWARNVIRTTDGGKTWKPVQPCRIKTEIAGLMRDAECYFHSVHFPKANTGYAIGPLPENSGNVLARTDDGGDTWKTWVVLPGESSHEGAIWFQDENTGAFRAYDGKMFRTVDGGKTWTGVSGQAAARSELAFADGEVGWMINFKNVTYTSNGGKSWLSREIPFPAMVTDSTLPARNTGYAVGEHGMVYRYRIVPIDYNVKGMLAAPAISAM